MSNCLLHSLGSVKESLNFTLNKYLFFKGCQEESDIVIILDETAILSLESSLAVLEWLQSVTEHLPLGGGGTRLALVSIKETTATVHFRLSQFQTTIEYLNALTVPLFSAKWVDLSAGLR